MEKQALLGINFMMNKIRKFEEKAVALFEANKLRGSVHLCIGQEALDGALLKYGENVTVILMPIGGSTLPEVIQKG